MTELSPAAQAVYDAATTAAIRDNADWPVTIAAALRAAADQVVPERPEPTWGTDTDHTSWWVRDDVREELLAIATELEGATCDPLEPQDLSHLSDEEFHALAPQGYHGV